MKDWELKAACEAGEEGAWEAAKERVAAILRRQGWELETPGDEDGKWVRVRKN